MRPDVNKDGINDIILVQSSYNLDNPSTKDRLTALIIKNGKVAAEKVIFDVNKTKFLGQGLFGHTIGCNTKIFVLNRSRTSFWRVY